MGIQDTMLCRFSSVTTRFGTVYYFLKPNNHGDKCIPVFEKYNQLFCTKNPSMIVLLIFQIDF